MSRPEPKRKTLKRHANRRAYERFGLEPAQVDSLVQMIRAGDSTFVERQSNRVVVHDVNLEGTMIRVVYDTSRKAVITVLHPEGIELFEQAKLANV